jgi:hypothetical protein
MSLEIAAIKALVFDLPPDMQARVKAAADRLRPIVMESPEAQVAFALIAAELAATKPPPAS